MDQTVSPTSDGAWLLWILGATVAVLTLHVGFEWVRQAQRSTDPAVRRRAFLRSGCTLGTGMCASMVLALTGEVQGFAIGYGALAALGLWLAASVLGTLTAACFALSGRVWTRLASGALLCALAYALQVGWILAVGFLPGLVWRADLLAGSVPLVLAGYCCGTWVALSASQQERRIWRLSWAWGAVALIAISQIAGQEVLMTAAGVLSQFGSLHALQLPGSMLTVVCGVLVPLVLAFLALDLAVRRGMTRRRRRRSRGSSGSSGGQAR